MNQFNTNISLLLHLFDMKNTLNWEDFTVGVSVNTPLLIAILIYYFTNAEWQKCIHFILDDLLSLALPQSTLFIPTDTAVLILLYSFSNLLYSWIKNIVYSCLYPVYALVIERLHYISTSNTPVSDKINRLNQPILTLL